MSIGINVYCDESCHLENDKANFMVLGAIYTRDYDAKQIIKDIKKIKKRHGYNSEYEIKWTKLRKSNIDLAINLLEYFFDNPKLRFRGYIINKSGLNHNAFSQSHDEWYYKIYYRMLVYLIDSGYEANIYLDKKDSRSFFSESNLMKILNNYAHSWNLSGVKKLQSIQSHESQILQITDLIIGAIRYLNDNYSSSDSKLKIIELIKNKSNLSLKNSTSLSAAKFNLFVWNMGVLHKTL